MASLVNKDSNRKVLAVVGPTGSGKTKLGIELAKEFNGIIISADSRQVYEGLDVGTNKEGEPCSWLGETSRCADGVNQLLIDVAQPGERFTLADWLLRARQYVEMVQQNGQLPIIVGGTGLYVTALIEGWQPGGENLELRKELEQLELVDLQERASDLGLNQSDFQNKHRLVRALERFSAGEAAKIPVAFSALVLQRDLPVEQLYLSSDERYPRIFSSLVNEVEALVGRGVAVEWLDSIGLDYRYAVRFYQGQLSRDEAINQFQQASRQYIKRQLTWWRHHQPVAMLRSTDEAYGLVSSFLKENKKAVE